MMVYNIRVLEVKENENSYDALIRVYNGEVKEENCVHIMTITISPKPPQGQLEAELRKAIGEGMKSYLAVTAKKLANQPTRVYDYNEKTGALV